MKPKKSVKLSLFTAVLLVFALAAGNAQAAPVMVQNSSGDLSIFTLPSGGGTATVTPVSTAGFTYNNLGYSSTFDYPGGTAGHGSLVAIKSEGGFGAQLGLIQINPSTGAIANLGLTTGLPTGAGTAFQAGDAHDNFLFVTYGVADGNTNTDYEKILYTINLTTNTATPKDIQGANAVVADWAYVPSLTTPEMGILYGGNRETGTLWSLNPATGDRMAVGGTFNVGPVTGSGGLFGAAWYDPDPTNGGIFLYRNDPFGSTTPAIDDGGRIYRVSTGGNLLDTWTAPGVSVNDGAFVRADVPIVPIPGAAWLLGSGIIGLAFVRRRFKS
jgi:hypothetical protein